MGDFAITGEPTDLRIGVQAKGVLATRLVVGGRSAHGSTPWLGDNAVLKAMDVFRAIESMPFTRASSELFDRPSISLGRIAGGDAINRVPDPCQIDLDIRYLPGQDPDEILDAINTIPRTWRWSTAVPPRADTWPATSPTSTVLADAVSNAPVTGAHRRGSRRHIRRHLLPERRHPGGGVRAGRRRPSRAREWVSIESLEVPPGARAFLQAIPGSDSGNSTGAARLRLDRAQAAARVNDLPRREEETLLGALQPRRPDLRHRRPPPWPPRRCSTRWTGSSRRST